MLKYRNDDTLFTATREGKIMHLNARVGGFDLAMPVKIAPDNRGCPMPVKDDYGYVYALPSGRTINLHGDVR